MLDQWCAEMQKNNLLWQRAQHSMRYLVSRDTRWQDKTLHTYISGRAISLSDAGPTLTLYFSSLKRCLSATHHLESLWGTTYWNVISLLWGNTLSSLDFSQHMLRETGHSYDVVALWDPPLPSRELIPFLRDVDSTFLIEGVEPLLIKEVKLWTVREPITFLIEEADFFRPFFFDEADSIPPKRTSFLSHRRSKTCPVSCGIPPARCTD